MALAKPNLGQHDKAQNLAYPLTYYALCVVLYIITLPFLLLSSLRAKHKHSIPARFFPPFCTRRLNFKPRFWFHVCSFGEVRSISPIINAMPKEPILITTITHTGFSEAKRLYKDSHIKVRYLPFEIFLYRWSKDLERLETLVVSEAEMWKMLFFTAKKVGAKTMLINARISSRSYKSYKRFRGFYKSIFALIDEVLAQSKVDKERLATIGAKNISIFGNLKILSTPTLSANYTKPHRAIILAASTHRGEEKLILQAFKSAFFAPDSSAESSQDQKPLLIIAPRHPERFSEVYALTQSAFRESALFSKINMQKLDSKAVVVIDKLGELNNLYAIADVAILGGSFVRNVGGHNPLEPAFFNTRLISGEHIFNQLALFECVANYLLITPSHLTHTLKHWRDLKPSEIIKSDNSLTSLLSRIQGTL